MSDIAINPVTRRVQFTGNTGTGPFAFTFNILQDADITVYKNTTLLTLTTDYTVSTNANGTGSITLVSGQALVSTDVLTIIGGRELSRTTDFVTAGDLLASSLNEQLDSNVIMTQQLDEKVTRSIRQNAGDEDGDMTLPLKDDRANKFLKFDATGNPGVQSSLEITGQIIGANYVADNFTGDGSDTTFTLSTEAGSKNNMQVYIDGVYQQKNSYSLSGTTLTFSEAPPNNASIEVVIGTAIETSESATAVNFTQPYTSASVRTVQDKLEDVVSVKDFGAVGDGVTDDTIAVRAALEYAAANDVSISVNGQFAIYSTITITAAACKLQGLGADYSRFIFQNGSGIDYDVSTSFGYVRNIAFSDPNARGTISPKYTTPLLRIERAFGMEISGCTFNGEDNRRFGLKVGDGAAAWASRYIGNRFNRCDIGVQIGSTNDQTHTLFMNNTVDHNKICGAVFAGLESGVITANSFEFNEGKTALGILSQAFGNPPLSRGFVVSFNYSIRNCGDVSGDPEAIPFKIGVDIPDTDFTTPGTNDYTSNQQCQQFEVIYNQILETDQYSAMKIKGFRHFRVEGNLTAKNAASSYDIELSGSNGSAIITGNVNANTGASSAILNSGSGTYKTPLNLADGDATLTDAATLNFDSTASLTTNALLLGDADDAVGYSKKGVVFEKRITGSGGSNFVICDLDAAPLTNAGIIEVQVCMLQSNGTNGSVHKLTVTGDIPNASGDSYQITNDFDAPSAPVDGTSFTISGSELRVTRTSNFIGTATITATNKPFSF